VTVGIHDQFGLGSNGLSKVFPPYSTERYCTVRSVLFHSSWCQFGGSQMVCIITECALSQRIFKFGPLTWFGESQKCGVLQRITEYVLSTVMEQDRVYCSCYGSNRCAMSKSPHAVHLQNVTRDNGVFPRLSQLTTDLDVYVTA
jgi:hypothetical protein